MIVALLSEETSVRNRRLELMTGQPAEPLDRTKSVENVR
jgi:hypothetical protein